MKHKIIHVEGLPGGPVEFWGFEEERGKEKIPQLFVSHTTADAGFIKTELMNLLPPLGILPAYLNQSMRLVGKAYKKTVLQVMYSTQWFSVLLSPGSVESQWVRFEVDWAFKNRPHETVIPILMEACDYNELHPKLCGLELVDYTLGREIAQIVLLRKLGK